MARLDAELDVLLKQWESRGRQASAPAPDGDQILQVALRCTGDASTLTGIGFRLGSQFGPVAYGEIALKSLRGLSLHPLVLAVDKQRKLHTHLHKSAPDIHASQVWGHTGLHFTGYTGRGVIVGIVDTGIDFRHMNFRREGAAFAHTRILRIWDQTLSVQLGEKAPDPIRHPVTSVVLNPLGYGVEYTEQQINGTLGEEVSVPAVVPVRHKDVNGHGSHVAGIAAGNGWQSGGCHDAFTYIGIAPEVDLVIVRLWGLTTGDSAAAPAGGRSSLSDAIQYIFEVARQANRAAVVNCSVGEFTEHMDGTAQSCVDVDNLLTTHSQGRAIVFSSGNDGNMGFHASAPVPAGPPGPNKSLVLPFRIYDKDTSGRSMVVLYNGSNLRAQLQSPVPNAPGLVPWVNSGAADGVSLTANGAGAQGEVRLSNVANAIRISITPPKDVNGNTLKNMAGTWTLELQDTGATATPVDALCLYGSTHDPKSPRWLAHTTSRSTLSQHASGRECIAVGNCRIGGALDASSSRGPTLEAVPRTKPELAAPGIGIISARSSQSTRRAEGCTACCCDCCLDSYTSLDGTSMAAPHVSGVIALMLHKNPTLTHTQIRAALVGHCSPKDSGSTPDDDFGWGAGRLDAKAVVDSLAQVNPPVARLALAPMAQPQGLSDLRSRWLATPRGPRLQGLVEAHAREVWTLIQSNRRVATIWHRCRGPVWVRLALRAVHEPGRELPLAVEGLSLQQSLRRFALALRRYGSPQLSAHVEEVSVEIDRIADGMSLLDLMDELGRMAAAPLREPQALSA